MTVRTNPTVTAAVFNQVTGLLGGYDLLPVIDASDVTIDEGAVPWITARLIIDTPTAAVASKLQPGQPNLVIIEMKTVETVAWNWYLVVTSYAPRSDGTVELALASFDTRLLTYTPITVDRGCWALQDDIWLIWKYVLSKVYGGSSDEDGTWDIRTTDADPPVTPFRTYMSVANEFPNPSVTSLTGFVGRTNLGGGDANVTLSQVAGTGSQASYGNGVRATARNQLSSLDIHYTAGGTTTTPIPASAGQTYTASVQPRASSGSPAFTGNFYMDFLNADGTTIKSSGRALGVLASTYQGNARASVTGTAPVGTVGIRLVLRAYGNILSGNVLDGAQWMLVEGDGIDTDGGAIPYFNGDVVNGTAGYNYAWQATPGASASTRTPVVSRDRDALTWKPGQSAYDFLEPILQALGLRTFAYGTIGVGSKVKAQPLLALTTYQYSRRSDYNPITGNQVGVAAGSNLYDIDVQSAIGVNFPDGTPMYADAVVIHYLWTDESGAAREAYDTYSPRTSFLAPYVIEQQDTPFPGPGRAINLYRRMVSRRRLVTVTHRLAERIEPGVLMTIDSPEVGSIVGYVDSTSHDLTNGVSRTRIKDAVDYPAYAWLRQPTGKSWTSIPTGTSWATFTP